MNVFQGFEMQYVLNKHYALSVACIEIMLYKCHSDHSK